MEQRPKIGLVIGSEGLKALAALPAIEFMQQNGLSPDLVIGCGGGGLIAAFLGAGYSMPQVEKGFCSVQEARNTTATNNRVLTGLMDQRPESFKLGSGLYNPSKQQRVYERIFNDLQLEDLNPKVVIQTVDIQNGDPFCLEDGPVSQAVYATSSHFPLMPPLRKGNRLLVDGSYSAPLPIMEAVNRGMDLIVGIYVEDDFSPLPGGLSQCYMNVVSTFRKSLFKAQQFQAIDLHDFEIMTIYIPGNRVSGKNTIPEIIDSGKQALEVHKQAITNAATQFTNIGRMQFSLHRT
ncbi:patatin-like phospholipase family protein [Desulfoplanes sp.]